MAQVVIPELKREQPLEQGELPQDEYCDAHHSGCETGGSGTIRRRTGGRDQSLPKICVNGFDTAATRFGYSDVLPYG